MQKLPQLIVIGAMKCGTTSLYNYLASNPALDASSKKETDFFRDQNFSKGVDWYHSFWSGSGKVRFEVSPNYAKHHLEPDIPKRIYQLIPKVKIIYMVRDPVDRLFSHFVHNFSCGRETTEPSSFFSQPSSNYIKTGRYYYQLQSFLRYFSPQNIRIVDLYDLQQRSTEVLKDLADFIGVDNQFDSDLLDRRFNTSIEKMRHCRVDALATLSKKQRLMLLEHFTDDIHELETFTGRTFTRWYR